MALNKRFYILDGLEVSGDIVDQDTGEIIAISDDDFITNGKHIQAGLGSWLREDTAGSRQVGFDATTSTQLDFYVGGAVEASLTASGLTGLESLNLADSKILSLGTGNDFQMSFNGSSTYFNAVAGNLYFQDNGATIGAFIGATFRMNDSKILSLGSGADWEFQHTGTGAYMDLNVGNWHWRDGANSNAIRMLWDPDAGLRAYDSHYFALGTGADFQMSFDGTDAIFNATAGDLKIQDNGTDRYTFGTTNGDLSITGDFSQHNVKTYTFSRTIPTSTGDIVELGSHSFANGAGFIEITAIVSDSAYSVSKQYRIPVAYAQETAWCIVQPLFDSGGYASETGNDFQLEYQITTSQCQLRARRASGATAGTMDFVMTVYSSDGDTNTFTESSTTSTETEPTIYHNAAIMTMHDDYVDIQGDLTLEGTVHVGSASGTGKLILQSADDDVPDDIEIYSGSTLVGQIGTKDTTWLRINNDVAKNIYTPRYIRADAGFFVDGATKGIDASGNYIGGTITGASDANVSNWDTAFGWGDHSTAGYQDQDAFLDDIAALTDPNADRILFWDDSAGTITWLTAGTNLTITGTQIDASGGAAGPLNDLTDVTITSVANDEILQYTGSGWENQTLSEAGIQPSDAGLTDIAGLAVTNSNFIVGNGSNWVAESGATARASLGLTIGTHVQAYDAGLNAIAGLATTDSNIIVGNGSTWVAESGATARTSLGLGTGNNVEFTNVTASGHFDGPAEKSSTTSGTLAAGDANTTIAATGGITIPNSTYSAGDIIMIANNSASSITLTATITTMRLAGTGTTGNRMVAQRGLAVLYFISGTEVIVGGDGVT